MRKGFWYLIFFVITLGIVGFLKTGGVGLYRLYKYYLLAEIPDKKYGSKDFTDRGAGELLNGYYAGSFENKLFMWTLSGLKGFEDKPGVSVYYYLDVCSAYMQITSRENTENKSVGVEQVRYEKFVQWRDRMKIGDFVWVKRLPTDEGVIDKASGSSNKYYPDVNLSEKRCKK